MSERYIFKKKMSEDYTVLSNHLIKDKTLSWQARGLLVYLLSKPDNWTVTKLDLENQSPAGGDAVATILKELHGKAYIKREKFQNEVGRWEWRTFVFDEPFTTTPQAVSGQEGYIVSTDIPSTTTKKGDLMDAMSKYSVSTPDDIDPLVGYPADVIAYLKVFIAVSGIRPIKSQKGDWIKSAREWDEMGIRATDVNYMFAYAVDKEWGIARPGSITSAYNMMRSQPNKADDLEAENRRLKELHG